MSRTASLWRRTGTMVSLLCIGVPVAAAPVPKAGDATIITDSYETASQTSDGSSSGSSHGNNAVVERVIAVRDDGVELEYDLPDEATDDDKARVWQYPARVLKALDGSKRLLNADSMTVRVDTWLKLAGWTRAACGRWGFTWTAFQVDCDPSSVLTQITEFDLDAAYPRDGAPYRHPMARGSGSPIAVRGPGGRTSLSVVLEVDPDAVRRERAASDVAVGEITGKPITLGSALERQAKAGITGKITVNFDIDPAGTAWRRTVVTRLQTREADGMTRTDTSTVTTERQSVTGKARSR